MSNTFTPTDAVDMNKEKDWAASIGMMDWDTTSIVFTKRTLIEFLRYTGTTVDTNFSNISKLPKYAKFGKISPEPNAEADLAKGVAKLDVSESVDTQESAPKSSHQVRKGPDRPGLNLFEEEFPDDALSQAPPKDNVPAAATGGKEATPTTAMKDPIAIDDPIRPPSGVRPSRRVRTAPGGKDSLADGLWGDADNTEFKPTRRVRHVPGGQDSVASLLG